DLMTHPEQTALLLSDRNLLTSAVEEELRYSPPITHFRRTATRRCILADKEIQEGQKVVVWYVSANRDEEVFDRPDAFDITRQADGHVTFGHGVHFCIGQALARLTLTIGLERYLSRMPAMRFCEEPVRLASCALNGYKRMVIR